LKLTNKLLILPFIIFAGAGHSSAVEVTESDMDYWIGTNVRIVRALKLGSLNDVLAAAQIELIKNCNNVNCAYYYDDSIFDQNENISALGKRDVSYFVRVPAELEKFSEEYYIYFSLKSKLCLPLSSIEKQLQVQFNSKKIMGLAHCVPDFICKEQPRHWQSSILIGGSKKTAIKITATTTKTDGCVGGLTYEFEAFE